MCPALVRILTNCYRVPSALYTSLGKVLLSCEGTTQGDPLGMAMYAMGTMPLKITAFKIAIQHCNRCGLLMTLPARSDIAKLRQWWDDLQRFGPACGYNVKPPKCWLIVKPQHYDLALEVFEGAGVHVSTEGKPYLGAGLGTEGFVEDFVKSRVNEWTSELSILCKIAQSQPHAAFAPLIHGVLSKWTYLQWTVPGVSHMFQPWKTFCGVNCSRQ